MGAAILLVTHDLLLDALGLPEGTLIDAIEQTVEDVANREWRIVLFHNDLPLHVKGASPITLTLAEVHEYIGGDPALEPFAGLSPQGFAAAAKLGMLRTD